MYIFTNNKQNLQGLPCLEAMTDQDTTVYIHRVCGDANLNINRPVTDEDLTRERNRLKVMLNITDDDFVEFGDIFKAQDQARQDEFAKYLVGDSYRGFVVGVSATFLNSFVPYTKFPEMEARFEDRIRKKWKEFLVNGQNQQGKNYIELVELTKNSCNLQDFKVLYQYMASLNVPVLTLSEAEL